MNRKRFFLPNTFIILCIGIWAIKPAPVTSSDRPQSPWLLLEPGLEFGTFSPPKKSEVGDSLIRVLRIDPRQFKFSLLNASASPGGKRLSAREWVRRNGMVAAINASMYQADNKTSVSLMKTRGHVNNSWFSKDRSLLAFDPTEPQLPAVQILDRDCQNVPRLRKRYQTLIQSIRMISCNGKNVWSQQKKKWSTAAIGMDRFGFILFIHVRSPFSTHDLIANLLKLPLNLKRAMYVEGGSEAQLYIRSGKREMEFVGSYSTGSNETDANNLAWPIPNVVAISRIPVPKTQ
ncbi:MAG: phosphodiester glycosidase family protein [Nitrospinaceae bacterium]|nr:phosphodiester glycosidase family protein [Nitrospinaceae bacterium]NIR53863.1 phosphodiester glycosidase family protein [Nitrospinaceae bacterium]NIS84277.1 phosphodiester glycosidase family protein [Nitrospinaceae bacterium]NIT81084.1 phosphodiester glycosidase family protein [Nitrospinaceae bacterium]NIU43366.1 phosphodiester glycosidase family protein [Nitrospinaceae bacterium]